MGKKQNWGGNVGFLGSQLRLSWALVSWKQSISGFWMKSTRVRLAQMEMSRCCSLARLQSFLAILERGRSCRLHLSACAVVRMRMRDPAPENPDELNCMSSKSSRFLQNANSPSPCGPLKSSIHGYWVWAKESPSLLGSQLSSFEYSYSWNGCLPLGVVCHHSLHLWDELFLPLPLQSTGFIWELMMFWN